MADLRAAIEKAEEARKRLTETLGKTCGKDLGIRRPDLVNELEMRACDENDALRTLLSAAPKAEEGGRK